MSLNITWAPLSLNITWEPLSMPYELNDIEHLVQFHFGMFANVLLFPYFSFGTANTLHAFSSILWNMITNCIPLYPLVEQLFRATFLGDADISFAVN